METSQDIEEPKSQTDANLVSSHDDINANGLIQSPGPAPQEVSATVVEEIATNSSSGNTENRQQGDIPRNTPPPDYNPETTHHQSPAVSEHKSPPNGATVGNTTDLTGPSLNSSFWLVGNYKKIVKKVDDGAKMCEELSQMMLERAEIESLYAKKLTAWNKKWTQSFSKGLEYGSLLKSLAESLDESNAIADIHSAIQGKIFEVSQQVQSWKVEHYHKGIIGLKETKKLEDGFSKAQKPWAKKYDDTLKGRQSYHSACQTVDISKTQEAELRANKENTTQDQIIKIENKVKKAIQDRENALEFYKDALRDIGNYNQKYKEDMVYEYEKWETAEKGRKEFVIKKIKEFKDCVDVTSFHERFEKIYSKMADVYNSANGTTDLEWFRRSFGPDQQFIDISFIEYDPQVKSKSQVQAPEANTDSKSKKSSKVCVAL